MNRPAGIMNKLLLRTSAGMAVLISCGLLNYSSATAQSETGNNGLSFSVRLPETLANEPMSGRLYVFLSENNTTPMNGPNWFNPEPFFGIEVSNWQPGTSLILDDTADGCPCTLSELPEGTYHVQAVMDQDFYKSSHARGAGNLFSDPVQMELSGDRGQVELTLAGTIPAREVEQSEWFKIVRLDSELLEGFHGRPVYEEAAVILPASYAENPDKRYPVYYDITGFGGTLAMIQSRYGRRAPTAAEEGDVEFIRVFLTGQCKWGHHVYANSATNGPRGDALINEMIPLIDSTFRTIAEPTARFVGGHSSGGWSSLWLQVNYPDTFGGVWSTAPDPVDFRDFQCTNLYEEGASVFVDKGGNERPLARRGNTPVIFYRNFCLMDDVIGRGGQLRSFEAAFSPLDENGQPRVCWDRETGEVDPEVAEYWKQYDIGLILQNNWDDLEPKLRGKLHVYMGTLDTFYLEGATELLQERMDSLDSDAQVELFEGRDHSNLLSRELRQRIEREMSEQFRKFHPEW
ncbi:MAG: alpha/beta hydrolase-fold protein [Planctomycetota bacterium]